MAVSTTTFADRLTRLETSTAKLYAGDETPQAFKPENLIHGGKKAKTVYWTAVMIGALMGAFVGHMFKTNVGAEMFFAQPLPVLYAIIKADQMTAAICAGMLAGPVMSIGFLIFSRTKNRLAQFWGAYVLGIVGINLTTWWALYLTLSA